NCVLLIANFCVLLFTDHKNLWREVAEANNRQNSMSAAALRANDEIQVNLENEFKDLKVFYERQEGAFENISRDNRERFEEEYLNSIKEPIYIDTLAQAIVCASDLALSYANRTSEIFENLKLYEKVFSNKNLHNIRFLVFAHNIRRVIEYAIRNAIPGNATKIYADFKGNKYRDLFTRLILKVIIKNKETEEYLEEYGNVVLSGKGKMTSNLIEILRKIIKSPDSPILRKATEIYRNYNRNVEKFIWEKQDNQELLNSICNKLRLTNIDIFDKVVNDL
ncbi:MAG: AIPR family protein, partial [Segetibacter sp.]